LKTSSDAPAALAAFQNAFVTQVEFLERLDGRRIGLFPEAAVGRSSSRSAIDRSAQGFLA